MDVLTIQWGFVGGYAPVQANNKQYALNGKPEPRHNVKWGPPETWEWLPQEAEKRDNTLALIVLMDTN